MTNKMVFNTQPTVQQVEKQALKTDRQQLCN